MAPPSESTTSRSSTSMPRPRRAGPSCSAACARPSAAAGRCRPATARRSRPGRAAAGTGGSCAGRRRVTATSGSLRRLRAAYSPAKPPPTIRTRCRVRPGGASVTRQACRQDPVRDRYRRRRRDAVEPAQARAGPGQADQVRPARTPAVDWPAGAPVPRPPRSSRPHRGVPPGPTSAFSWARPSSSAQGPSSARRSGVVAAAG